jgi:hypothetical protein
MKGALKEKLHEILTDMQRSGCANARSGAEVYRLIRKEGFEVSYSTVKREISNWKRENQV